VGPEGEDGFHQHYAAVQAALSASETRQRLGNDMTGRLEELVARAILRKEELDVDTVTWLSGKFIIYSSYISLSVFLPT
jgi:hypothetical protein